MEVYNIKHLEDLLKFNLNGNKIEQQSITRLTAAGDNYLSLMLKVDLKVQNQDYKQANGGQSNLANGENHDGNSEKYTKTDELHIVAKMAPPAQLQGESFMVKMINDAFKLEIAWYGEIIPVLENFEKECGVTGFTDIYPKFYGGRLNLAGDNEVVDEDAVLLLENLQDYKTLDRLIGFDYQQSKEVLRTLSRFHTLSIALRLKKPEIFEKKILANLQQSKSDDNQVKPPDFGFSICKGTLEVLQESGQFSEHMKKFEEILVDDGFSGLNKKREVREPWGTTAHADFWTNNIMVKNTEIETKMKFVDFQMVKYQSFASDVAYFLLLSVQNSVQNTKMDELIRYYYDNFIENLKKLDVATEPFTYVSYLKELAIEAKNDEFYRAIMFTNVILADKEDIPDMVTEENKEVLEGFLETWKKKSPAQKEKIINIARLCVERNWI